MQEFCKADDLKTILDTLEFYYEKYGNLPINIDLSMGKPEGIYNIESICYSTDEVGNKSISLIVW